MKSDSKLYRSSDFIRGSDRYNDPAIFRSAYSPHTAQEYGIIISSLCFRRLQGKMQLFPSTESPLLRNRLTHSLEVAHVASRIATLLNSKNRTSYGKIDTSIVAAAALAHDIGHPPFGHSGEKALSIFMNGHGSFEGNAQTIRIVTKLENRQISMKTKSVNVYKSPLGLNLLYRTIASLLKYNSIIPNNQEEFIKGYYEDDAEIVKNVLTNVFTGNIDDNTRTIECQIMDLADDIAYSTYDLEDCMIAGVSTPFDMLAISDDDAQLVANRASESLSKRGYNYALTSDDVRLVFYKIFESLVTFNNESDYEIRNIFDKMRYVSSTYRESNIISYDYIHRRHFTDILIDLAVNSISIDKWEENNLPASKIKIDENYLLFIEILKHYNYLKVILSTRLDTYSRRASHIIGCLTNVLMNGELRNLMPFNWKGYYDVLASDGVLKEEGKKMRFVCDFIASLTDAEALKMFMKFTSGDERTIFDL